MRQESIPLSQVDKYVTMCHRIVRLIQSCQTTEHTDVAYRYITLARKTIGDKNFYDAVTLLDKKFNSIVRSFAVAQVSVEAKQ